MKRNAKVCLVLALTAIVLAAVIVLLGVSGEVAAPRPQPDAAVAEDGLRRSGAAHPASADRSPVGRDVLRAPQSSDDATSSDDDAETAGSQSGEENHEAEEEKFVDAFDNLTDKWMEPSKQGVTMADVDGFATAFRKLPRSRRDECVHRALNLVPDENVMLLAGILMDKEMDREIVETVYNDILNRDESVKKPILQQIFGSTANCRKRVAA